MRRRRIAEAASLTLSNRHGMPNCAAPGDLFGRRISGGAVAQLGERLNGIQEVGGSTPLGSTNETSRLTKNAPRRSAVGVTAEVTQPARLHTTPALADECRWGVLRYDNRSPHCLVGGF